MANRLKLVIPAIISESQQAFVPDRLMSDGCLIAHEIMHYMNKTKKGTNCYSVIKLDMHKAFDRATPASFEAIRDIFQGFEEVSGQMINLQKTFIKFSPNSPEDFKTHMTSILRMKASDSFGTYLGVPVDLPKCKKTAFIDILDKITMRISALSSLHLSQASKFFIINSILLGSLVHILAPVPLPISILKKLDSLIAAFWWSKHSSHRSIHWLSQQHLHNPRDKGGLSIKFVTILGQAYLMKNFWRIHHKPEGLLAKYLKPKYKRDLPVPKQKSNVSQPSFVWQGICRVASSFTDTMAWKVGNGNSINLLSSHWIQGHPPRLRHDQGHTISMLSDFVTDNCSWKLQNIFRVFDTPTAKTICAMELPIIANDDFLY
ncbi:uncharacterized protein LOC141608419 [Silene latifolia]|uniref:uncharacterized protein LOC141608419 n=1 Tax=Silene latifolia TaxID=37657 RepID=UPI003D76E7CE